MASGIARRRVTAGLVAASCLLGTAVLAAPSARQAVPSTTFVTYPIPTTVRGADFAGEPSIGVDWETDEVLYQSSGNTLRFTPSTAQWSDATPPTYTNFNIDPILATDPTTGLTFAGGDDGSCSILAVSKDDGQNWQPSLPCSFTPDHPTVGIGPVVGTSPQAGQRVAYFCQQYPVAEECTTSRDDGLTWLPAVPVTGGCAGLFGHVKIGSDGTAYLPIRECKDQKTLRFGIGGAVSTNNGRRWKSFKIPNAPLPRRGFDPSIAITPDHTVYETWAPDPDFKPVVAWSRNRGKTWSKPIDVTKGAPYPIYATTFHAAVAGDSGRVAIAYLGADRPGTAAVTPFDDGYVGAWYLYVTATYDGGKHWTTTRVQDNPVQLGPICDNGTTCISGRNLLDFIDAGVTREGQVIIGYAEGCQGGCPADVSRVAESTHAWGAIALQTTGPSLFR
jgi:hypothetical protein